MLPMRRRVCSCSLPCLSSCVPSRWTLAYVHCHGRIRCSEAACGVCRASNTFRWSSAGASLKLTILNPKGRVWTMVAGGGASVIYTDTVGDLGYAQVTFVLCRCVHGASFTTFDLLLARTARQWLEQQTA